MWRWAPVLTQFMLRGYLRLCRTKLTGNPWALDLLASGHPVLMTPWHCHLLFPLVYVRRLYAHLLPPVLIASPSRDGEFIGNVARSLHLLVIPGSQRKGGAQAIQKMAEYMRRGHSGCIVADGSRGPARVAQKGVVFLARETQAPIIPVAVAARRKKVFNSWDRFELPLPLSPVVILVGEPFRVLPRERGTALEARRLELEVRLNALYHQSQTFFASGKNFSFKSL